MSTSNDGVSRFVASTVYAPTTFAAGIVSAGITSGSMVCNTIDAEAVKMTLNSGPSAARDERRFAGNYPGTSRRNMNARESPTDLAFADEKPKQTRFIFRCPFVLRHSPNANICPSFVTIFSSIVRAASPDRSSTFPSFLSSICTSREPDPDSLPCVFSRAQMLLD